MPPMQLSFRTIAALAFAATAAAAIAQTGAAPRRAIPTPLYGVTVDDVSRTAAIVNSLSMLPKRATTRIVFDEFVDPAYYRAPTVRISEVSYVMGEILDSSAMRQYSVDGFTQRVNQYVAALGDVVDIWEVGNEINGEWLGPTPDVVAKMTKAYDIVQGQGRTTALTLYYNQGCWENASNEMFRWAEANIPAYMKQGLDYVLVSYYEDDCNGLQPNWQPVFDRLHAMFPHSRIGFGEVGTTRKNRKAASLTRYYGMRITTPNYVGGYFWWYFRQDMVPATKALWTTLRDAIARMD